MVYCVIENEVGLRAVFYSEHAAQQWIDAQSHDWFHIEEHKVDALLDKASGM